MKITMISILICCIWTVSSAIQPQQQIPGDERTTFQGDVEAVGGSPVSIYHAGYELVRPSSSPGATKVVGHVKIENVSNRPIRLLRLSFLYKVGFPMGFAAVAGALSPREIRDYVVENMTLEPPKSPGQMSLNVSGMTLNVMATGAEFQDGSHWAAPRTESRPLVFWPNNAAVFFVSRGWRSDRAPHEALFDVVDPGVVAYRLGLVTDTPSRFEVSLGEWAELAESERYRGSQVIEPGRSLTLEQMPGAIGLSGTGRHLPGVAIFIAELRFADGHIWRQDTRREELLWDI